MPATFRRPLGVAAAFVALGLPAAAQSTSSRSAPPAATPQAAAPAVPVPFTPPTPGSPGFPTPGQFTRSFQGLPPGAAATAMADTMTRLAIQMATLAAEERTNLSRELRHRRDSLQREMRALGHRMSALDRHDGRDWRQFARDARASALAAAAAEREAAAQSREAAAEAASASREALRGAGAKNYSKDIQSVRGDPDAIPMPPTASFVTGGFTVPQGDMHSGTVAVAGGNLDVYGMIAGDAVAVDGDVILHPGAHVTGSAFAANGDVRMPESGATVDGEIRSIEGPMAPGTVALGRRAAQPSRWHDFKVAFAGLCLALVLGVGVLTFAEEQLDNVTATLGDRFGRSVWYGIVGELALLPVLLALIIACCITIVGIIAVPFAIAGYLALAVGAATLGFMGVAQATGTAVLRAQAQATLTPRGAQLRALVTGISIYSGLWLLTAVIGADSVAGFVVRIIAVVITTVALTVGFGSVILWRFELRRARRLAAASAGPADDSVWLTPTPVAGVAAARRPVAASTTTPGGPT